VNKEQEAKIAAQAAEIQKMKAELSKTADLENRLEKIEAYLNQTADQ
jgi:hypothetical protein